MRLVEYLGKKVRIICADGEEFSGLVTGYEDAFDSHSGEDELELDTGAKHYTLLRQSEIAQIYDLGESIDLMHN